MFLGLCQNGGWSILCSLGGWSLLGLIFNTVISAVSTIGIILLIIWFIRRLRSTGIIASSRTDQPTAMDILQARFARGEITREQYELMQQDIA